MKVAHLSLVEKQKIRLDDLKSFLVISSPRKPLHNVSNFMFAVKKISSFYSFYSQRLTRPSFTDLKTVLVHRNFLRKQDAGERGASRRSDSAAESWFQLSGEFSLQKFREFQCVCLFCFVLGKLGHRKLGYSQEKIEYE